MAYKYELAVYIGRFQPFHIGHATIVEEALKQAKNILFVIGGSGNTRSTRNPFDMYEVKSMILRHFGSHPITDRFLFETIPDTLYNDQAWISDVQNAVKKYNVPDKNIALAGHKKDNTSYYLNLFPQWNEIAVEQTYPVSATDVRNLYFSNQSASHLVSHANWEYLQDITIFGYMKSIFSQFEFEKNYKKQYGKGPFVTTDACVHQGGHILLIQRNREYCFGQYALPGGFLNPDETVMDGMIRELMEETKIKVPEKVLKGSITQKKQYDAVHRSNRARIITNVFNIELNNVGPLPKVKASDDAYSAFWVPFSFVKQHRNEFFDDHYHIIIDQLNI